MKLRRHLVMMLVFAVAATVIEGSLLRRSLLQPEGRQPCFTSRAEDRPFAYPLIRHFVKLKDMVVRIFKAVVAGAKEHRLD